MAVGDLVGDLATAYLTPAQRAAQVAGVLSLTGGPIARASSQLPAATGLASLAPIGSAQPSATAPASQPASLASLSPGQSLASTAPSTEPGASTSQPSSLSALSPVLSPPSATTATNQAAPNQAQTVPGTGAQAAASLENAFRPTAIGAGSNAIVTRSGAGGVPEFSNQPADLASAAGRQTTAISAQLPSSLSQLAPGAGGSQDPMASLSSQGSAANLGDGVGTFSQAKTGDAALSMSRFQKANDLRQAYRDQDRLDAALAANTRANNTTIVRDSSRPLSRADIYRDQQDQAAAQGRLENITSAQNAINGRQQVRGTEQVLQRNARVEDILSAGQAPGATAEQKAAAQRILDPTGKNALAGQQAQAQLNNTQLEGQLKQQQIQQNTQTQQQAAQDRSRAQAGQVATIDQALGSVDSLLGTQVDPKNPNGPRLNEDPGLASAVGLSSILPTRPGSAAADFEARLDTLKAQSFLPQVALLKGAGALSDAEGKKLSDSIGALSTKMSEDAFRKSLSEIRNTFSASKERLSAGAPATASTSATSQARAAGPAIGTVQQGYVFLGGDPASQTSWRKQ